MRITHLSLTNFRNYARLEMPFPEGMIVLYGDNAQGKTSLLEAVYYLATSRSPYTASDRQLINWLAEDETLPFARLVAEAQTREGRKRIELTLVMERSGAVMRLRKEIRINGISRRTMDLLGQIRVVLFLPRDMALVEGTPSERRRYLDITLCQTDTEYCRALAQYNKVLTQRNALLRQLQERGRRSGTEEMSFWDDQLAQHGAALVAGRYRLVRELEKRAQSVHHELSGEEEYLRLRYEPGFDAGDTPEGQMSFAAEDLGTDALPRLPRREIAVRFRAMLDALRPTDIRRGITTIGPQRDEVRFIVNGHDLGMYGSRGQNRTAVLATKLAELAWMREQTGEWPVLLLDEVAAELDPARRAYLLNAIRGAEQVMLTTAEPYLLDDESLRGAAHWNVRGGTISVERG